MEVTGHADSAAYGRDLICAEVSAVMTGLCNAVDEFGYTIPLILKEGHVVIEAGDNDAHDLQVILKTGLCQLKTIEAVHSDFMKITKMEV